LKKRVVVNVQRRTVGADDAIDVRMIEGQLQGTGVATIRGSFGRGWQRLWHVRAGRQR
jgi:hypothetical protein